MDEFHGLNTVERALMTRSAAFGMPISGSLELLPLCNMNCRMCYVRLSRKEMEAQGRLRTWQEWLEAARQMQEAGVLFLLLTGGELLLFPEFKTLYLELKKMGFVLTINTNGTLLDEDWADFFAAHKPRRINITLYGADGNAYRDLCGYQPGFDRAIQAVKLLKQRQLDVKLATSVTQVNVQDLPRLFAIARELDVPMAADTYMMPATRERTLPFDQQSRLGPEEAAQARIAAMKFQKGFLTYAKNTIDKIDSFVPGPEEPKPMGCYAGKCSFSVSWQGHLHPCVILSEPAANVFEVGFQKAWEQVSQGVRQIRLNPKCSACALRPACRTCVASGLLEGGSHDALPEYMCRYAAESARLLRQALEEAHG